MPKTSTKYYQGVGRRKQASATARISRGKGKATVNGKSIEEYFDTDKLVNNVNAPLEAANQSNKFDITIQTSGGGKSGQSDAARLAIAKALTQFDESLRPTLKKAGYIKRDARVKERKKYGLKRARKAPQFTKR